MPDFRSLLQASRAQIVVVGFLLVLGALLRVLLYASFGTDAGVGLGALPALLARGALLDLIVALALVLPLSLLRAWRDGPVPTPDWRRLLIKTSAVVAATAAVYLAATEYLFFEEFDARFNLVAVDYLRYPTEVFGNIDATYPVAAILVAALGLALVTTGQIEAVLRRWPRRRSSVGGRAGALGSNLALLGLALASVGFEPAATFFTSNRVADEIAANGVIRFLAALRANDVDYPRLYLQGQPASDRARVVADLSNAGGRFDQLAAGLMTRSFAQDAAGLGRANVVIVVEESLGANHVTALGGDAGLTPQFDALVEQGLLFTRAYATGTRTVRGLEAIVTSFPPIPSESIVRRPGGENVANLGGVLRAQGYNTRFTYGGYAYFDDMQRFFEGNGFEVVDRQQMTDVRFANIWGVSDEDLFDNALRQMDALATQRKPFLNIILTTSNHKPFTFPANDVGIPTEGGGREAGVRYADHALGRFMHEALRRAWSANTVFVVLGDHSARVYGAARIPLATYRVPVLLLAPGRLAPRRDATRMSQLDLAPTLLGLLGLPYSAPFFGRDVLRFPDEHRAMLFNHNYSVAMWRDDQVVVLEPGKVATAYDFDPATSEMRMVSGDADMTKLAAAYFGTAYDLFHGGRYR